MYRVSLRSLFQNINSNLSRLTYEMTTLNNAIASGKKVNRPSDDPAGGATILSMRSILADIEQYNKDLAWGDDWLKQTEASLQNMKTVITDAKILCEQMSTDTYRPENMDVAADEVASLLEQLVKLGNTQIQGRYIFAGHKTDTAPFSESLAILDPEADAGNAASFTGKVLAPPPEQRAYTALSGTAPQTKVFVAEVTTAGGIGGDSRAGLTLDPAGDHNEVFFQATAAQSGSAGNAIRVEYQDPGAASQPLTVNVAGNDITVSLATDASGNIISTADDVVTAVNNDAAASALVTASLAPGSSGNGLVADTGGLTNLSGGIDGGATFRVSEDGGQIWGPDDAFATSTTATSIWNTTLDRATLTTTLVGDNNDLQFTAVAAGSAGNDVQIEYVNPGAGYGPPTDVTVVGNRITVNLETDAGGNVVATAQEVMDAINADPAASALVTASLADQRAGGGGVVTVMGLTNLAGGDDDLTPADQGVQLFFTNDGSALQVGDRFQIEVSYYHGDDQDLQINANTSTRITANITGEEALGQAGDEENILDVLSRLRYALQEHDTSLVAAELPHLDQALEHVTSQLAQVGARLNRTQVTQRVLDSIEVSSTERMSRHEDLDLTKAITDLQAKQIAYQAVLASTSLISQLSLVDFIH